VISPLAVFIPADSEGAIRPVELGDGSQVGALAVICGGTRIGDGARLLGALDQDPERRRQPGALLRHCDRQNTGPACRDEPFQPAGVLAGPDGPDPGQGRVATVRLDPDRATGEG
jgi:hypothetical protein